MREFLKGLELEADVIDKIMAEHGKLVTKDKEELQTLRDQVKDLQESSKNAEELKAKYDELTKSIKEQEAQRKAEENDRLLTQNISAIFGDRKFTSEYARQGLLNDIKEALNKPENKGKGIKDLFDELTKNKDDIFANPNQIEDMPSMGESEQNTNTKEIPTLW